VGWFRRLSLRSRLILIGTSGLAAGLLLGGLLLIAVLHYTLNLSLDRGATQTASDTAALLDANHLSDPIPTAGTQFIQVVDGQGRVLKASIGADRLSPLLHPAEIERARSGLVVVVGGDRVGVEGDLRVAAAVARGGDTVLVAAPDQDATRGLKAVAHGLLVAYPLLLLGLSMLAWWVVGWTLRPVEALRQGAEEISAAQVGRLPVPEGDDELHRLAVTLNRMLDRLEAARTRQRAFVADAAHELRSPIASLRTQLDVATHLGEPPAVADLSVDVDRLRRLVDDLLLLARADEADPVLRRAEPVDLGGVLDDVAAGYAGARVPVTVSTVDGPQWTVGDPAALRRVMDNLVANAVRHATSRVTLKVIRNLDRVVVTVTDDGPGIPARDRARVFDRFTRLDDARNRDDGGAGLGLAIVRELVRLHGGTVTLGDAAPGLVAAVALPAGRAPDPATPPAGPSAVERSARPAR
jgi:signal transduction histidine kinase